MTTPVLGQGGAAHRRLLGLSSKASGGRRAAARGDRRSASCQACHRPALDRGRWRRAAGGNGERHCGAARRLLGISRRGKIRQPCKIMSIREIVASATMIGGGAEEPSLRLLRQPPPWRPATYPAPLCSRLLKGSGCRRGERRRGRDGRGAALGEQLPAGALHGAAPPRLPPPLGRRLTDVSLDSCR